MRPQPSYKSLTRRAVLIRLGALPAGAALAGGLLSPVRGAVPAPAAGTAMPNGPSDADLRALLGRMTLDEKIGQLTMRTADMAVTGPRRSGDYLAAIRAGAVGSMLNLWGAPWVREAQDTAVKETRLGIPLFFGFDVVHGHRTVFPVPLAEAAAFDPDLWTRTARAAAAEAAADGIDLTFAPMLDVARDARWGRIVESPGEDPVVAARFGEAKIRGFQGGDLAAPDALAATPKHFAAYGAVTGGRDYASADISERTLREIYLPPFRAAVAAGAAAIMPAFIDIAGIPLTADRRLLTGVLREEWGFDGVVISDYDAIPELMAHGLAADMAEAAALALRAGTDIDMMGDAYAQGLPAALARGMVREAEIDAAVLRVLALKRRLGLFADPYRRIPAAPAPAPKAPVAADDAPVAFETAAGDPLAHRALAREAARRAVVLLTNRKDFLPLSPRPGRLALIGPLAHAAEHMIGPWSGAGRGAEAVSILDGLRAVLPTADIAYQPGVDIDGADQDGIPAALDCAREADVVLLCLGESRYMSGEAASRGRLDLPGNQRVLADAVLDLGKPTVAILCAGRPLAVPWLFERANAVLAAWFLGSEAGPALADVLLGAWNPTGRLPVSWPWDVGQVPIFYAQNPTGRPAQPDNFYTSKYLDLPVAPQFPFGHGLSYSRFVLSGLQVAPAAPRWGDRLAVSVKVHNDSAAPGEETVLLFLRHPVAAPVRPVLELQSFTRLSVPAQGRATARLDFTLRPPPGGADGGAALSRSGPATVELFVGPCADRARLLQADLQVDTAPRRPAG